MKKKLLLLWSILLGVPSIWQPEALDIIHLQVQMGIELFLVEIIR